MMLSLHSRSWTRFAAMYRAMRGTRRKYACTEETILIDRPSAALFLTGMDDSFKIESIAEALRHGFGRRSQSIASDFGTEALGQFLRMNPSESPVFEMGSVSIAAPMGASVYVRDGACTDIYVKLDRLQVDVLHIRGAEIITLDSVELSRTLTSSQNLADACRSIATSVESNLNRAGHEHRRSD